MPVEYILFLSSVLVGIGVGSALSNRNMISIIMALVTSSLGVLLAMVALDRFHGAKVDGALFALGVAAVMLIIIVLGCTLVYRRHMASSATGIDENTKLRH